MSTGRHARKRAAKKQEEFITEQENLSKKAEAEEKEKGKELESQRIATMRARFGGQAPEMVGDNEQSGSVEGMGGANKSQLPSKAQKSDSMRDTLISMYLDEQNGTQKSGKRIMR